MVFTSTVFLFAFLPVALITFYLFPAPLRVVPLVVLSCLFYGWGEPVLVVLIMVSAVLNFIWGRLLVKPRLERDRRLLLGIGIALNLLPLMVFKYLGFLLRTLGFEELAAQVKLPLPIGVSFYTFMAISYLIDIHRRRNEGAPNLLRFSAYLTMFPHLVAGPIVRWSQVGHQLQRPRFDAGLFGYGALRVSIGLAKKAVLADSLAPVVDTLFGATPSSIGAAWLGAGLYGLQIYFDFSAYSDIAIGIAAMLGVRFEENFRYPYVSRSAREFWQRWHISLSSWFRDYVYFPMGGSRVRPLLAWRNLLVVWALTGLWHGAAWTFVLWGMYFGVLIGLERFGLGALVGRMPRVGQHAYGVVVALIGWVLFRSVDVSQAWSFYRAMFGFSSVPFWDAQAEFAIVQCFVVVAICVALAAGVGRRLMDATELRLTGGRATEVTHAQDPAGETAAVLRVSPRVSPDVLPPTGDHGGVAVLAPPVTMTAEPAPVRSRRLLGVAVAVWVVLLLVVSTSFVVSVSYQPFIYFRF